MVSYFNTNFSTRGKYTDFKFWIYTLHFLLECCTLNSVRQPLCCMNTVKIQPHHLTSYMELFSVNIYPLFLYRDIFYMFISCLPFKYYCRIKILVCGWKRRCWCLSNFLLCKGIYFSLCRYLIEFFIMPGLGDNTVVSPEDAGCWEMAHFFSLFPRRNQVNSSSLCVWQCW